ncbi:hypothetical protein ACHAWF_002723 [Thalassiosira exigua]
MSSVYSTEPATTGHVVVDTTHGPIDINLWCKECPTTTRTFLQLCLDGYYDGMVFHRVLSDFLIQTGLTRNESMVGTPATDIDAYLRRSSAVPSSSSSMSGDALGLDRKKLELNPRIRFNHRGQVAMALPLEQSSDANEEESAMLQYQFFVTLDEALFLDAKHVVFGTVAGATMFNALRIGRTDADEQTGIPADMKDAPPRVKSVKVDYHPFEDLVATSERLRPWKDATNDQVGAGRGGNGKQSTMEKRRKKRKGKRDLNVLSFGDEEKDYEEISKESSKATSMLSSHDVLSKESKILSSQVDIHVEKQIAGKGERDDIDTNGTNKKFQAEIAPSSTDLHDDDHKPETKEPLDRKIHSVHNTEVAQKNKAEEVASFQSISRDDKHKISKSSKPKNIGAVEARRAKYLKSGVGSSANKKERLKREGDTMAKLFAFKTKVVGTKGSKEDGESSNGKGKTNHVDDSLAARMEKRAKQTQDEEDLRSREEREFSAMPGYSGQVDTDGSDQSDQEGAHGSNWMGTKFKCKRHMDQDSRTTAVDKIDPNDVGGDGRRMDDYVVLDGKRSGKDGKNGKRRREGQHDRDRGSRKYSDRKPNRHGHDHRREKT